ncbi:hypothetical protein FRB94_011700 [Tulasnella sp. JGI-2019a]|nr:hypothetical protein FRB94_011700 [Tulasnella sp. JGI-2019a]
MPKGQGALRVKGIHAVPPAIYGRKWLPGKEALVQFNFKDADYLIPSIIGGDSTVTELNYGGGRIDLGAFSRNLCDVQ